MRKPRADSRLKTLPPELRADIAAHAATHRLEETRAWLLAEKKIRTSTGALSEFLSWQRLQESLQANENTVAALMDWYRERHPDTGAEELSALGQAFFSALALRLQDPKVWTAIQHLGLKRRQLDLDREKLELLRRKAEQADRTEAVLNDAALTPAERQRRIREIYGRA
jgi:hypothetical protein